MARELSLPETFVLKSIGSQEHSLHRAFNPCYVYMTLIYDIRIDCTACYANIVVDAELCEMLSLYYKRCCNKR